MIFLGCLKIFFGLTPPYVYVLSVPPLAAKIHTLLALRRSNEVTERLCRRKRKDAADKQGVVKRAVTKFKQGVEIKESTKTRN